MMLEVKLCNIMLYLFLWKVKFCFVFCFFNKLHFVFVVDVVVCLFFVFLFYVFVHARSDIVAFLIVFLEQLYFNPQTI